MDIAKRISELGCKTYIVGGYVRDTLLGIKPADVDIFTEAAVDQILSIFPNANTKWTKWNVLIINGIDVASYRDGATTLCEDASRRDFTINALYYDFTSQTIIDPTHMGISDINNKIIRSVNSFESDIYRIIRCIRLAANLGFSIEESTYKSMIEIINRIDWDKLDYMKIWREIYKLKSFNKAVEVLALQGVYDDNDPLAINIYKFILNICHDRDICLSIINKFNMSKRDKKLITDYIENN